MTDEKKENPAKSEIAKMEEKILAFWQEKEIFKKSVEKESLMGEFVFYEGPPTANAAPALHHIESRAFKDVIPRYKTMRGFHVRRKAGWDTHGLPVELQVEKKLGLKSKKEIETYGIAEFNKECRENVWTNIDDWEKFTKRIGYWVDDANPYITYENSYMESLWNIVAHVNSKKLLYKDYKVVPWCPRCGTALSSHELAQGYEDITDISVYVKFKVKSADNTYVLAWTTTPWTLPGNVGLAVGEKISYVKVKVGEDFFILAKERISVLDGSDTEIVEEMTGSDLVGLEYEPLYPFMNELVFGPAKEAMDKAYKIYPADFVTTTDGTGVVHTAVMYGQEDFELGTKVGLPKFHLVSTEGTFISGTGFLEGKHVRDEETAVEVIKDLHARGLLLKKEKYKHSYPHCWRCKTALIYYARDSWYIRMSSLRKELLEQNEKINWEPAHIKDGRFGEWLREIKDWAISRERYWGTPLPVWECSDCKKIEVVGSLSDLKKSIPHSGNKYFLMRHGESLGNAANTMSVEVGDPGDALTDNGKSQAMQAAQKMTDKLDYIYCSGFKRSKETAEAVAAELGLSPEQIIVDERLGEFRVAEKEFNGQKDGWHKFWQKYPNPIERYTANMSAENYTDATVRMVAVFDELESKYKNKKILVISHELPLRLFLVGYDSMSVKEKAEKLEVVQARFQNAEVRTLEFLPLPRNSRAEIDFHRPYIDEVKLSCSCGGEMSRVKEVMDVWFDSGGMPFAQDHYPFENKEWVDGVGYPADFISEAIDQTRGWFYTLLAIGVLLDKGAPYKNVICLGHILDAQGKKMSKSIGNVVNPWEIMDKYGIDAVRLWMYSVNQPGDSKNFDEKTVEDIIKKIFNPISNTYTLFSTYESDVSRIDPRQSKNILDIWIMSKLDELLDEVTSNIEKYKLLEPVRSVRDFTQDFSTWYIRRSRERLKSDDLEEKSEVVSVTEYVLIQLAKILAPFAPFYADWLYLEVTKGKQKESVHLETWSTAGEKNAEVLENMKKVREVVTSALELRQKSGVKVRQPLQELKIKNKEYGMEAGLLDIIKDEINVKTVVMDETIEGDVWLDTVITEELKEEGVVRDIMRAIQDIRKKEGCSPTEKIKMRLEALPETVSLIQKNIELIQKTTGTEVLFVTEKQTHEINLDGTKLSAGIGF